MPPPAPTGPSSCCMKGRDYQGCAGSGAARSAAGPRVARPGRAPHGPALGGGGGSCARKRPRRIFRAAGAWLPAQVRSAPAVAGARWGRREAAFSLLLLPPPPPSAAAAPEPRCGASRAAAPPAPAPCPVLRRPPRPGCCSCCSARALPCGAAERSGSCTRARRYRARAAWGWQGQSWGWWQAFPSP